MIGVNKNKNLWMGDKGCKPSHVPPTFMMCQESGFVEECKKNSSRFFLRIENGKKAKEMKFNEAREHNKRRIVAKCFFSAFPHKRHHSNSNKKFIAKYHEIVFYINAGYQVVGRLEV